VTLAVYIVAGLVGWCPRPLPPPPPPPIEGLARTIAGIIGGIAGAYLVHWALGLSGALTAMDFIALMVGAFACGRVLQQLAIWIIPGREHA